MVCQTPGFVDGGRPPGVEVASGMHAVFSQSEGSAQLQRSRYPSGWLADSWGVARVPNLEHSGDRSQGPKPENQKEA